MQANSAWSRGLWRETAAFATLSVARGSMVSVLNWDGPLLLVGGAETGKTTAVATAAVAELRAGRTPLVLAPGRAAASTLRNRIAADAGGVTQLNVTTVHALARSLLDQYGEGSDWRLLTAPEQDLRWNVAYGNLPLRTSEMDTPEFKAQVKELPGLDVMAANSANAVQARPTVQGYVGLSEAIGSAISQVLQGKGTPTEALQQAAAKADQALADQ